MLLQCKVCSCDFECKYRKLTCSDECASKQRKRSRAKLNVKRRKHGRKKKRYKSGYKKDIGLTVRSGWEANVARILNYKGIPFEYEPRLYALKLRKSTVHYLPDFIINGKVVEVKGRHTKSLYKPRLLERQYGIKVFIIDAVVYKWLEKRYKKLIPNWE